MTFPFEVFWRRTDCRGAMNVPFKACWTSDDWTIWEDWIFMMLVDMVGPCFSQLQHPQVCDNFWGDGTCVLFNPFLRHYMRYIHFTQHQPSLDTVDLTTIYRYIIVHIYIYIWFSRTEWHECILMCVSQPHWLTDLQWFDIGCFLLRWAH